MSADQIKSYEEVDARLKEADFSAVIETTRLWDNEWLYAFCVAYPHRYAVLKHPDFDSFWAERRAQLLSEIAFQQQNNLADADFVLGYLYYLHARTDKNVQTMEKAIALHSIHAAQAHFNQLLQEAGDSAKLDKIKKLQPVVEKLAEIHGTPGFLLLANMHLQMAQLSNKLKDTAGYKAACSGLWENLILAQLHEPQSATACHNAYFGKGLASANPFGITTIEGLKNKVSRLITDKNKMTAEAAAENKIAEKKSAAALLTWMQTKRQPESLLKLIDHDPGMSL